MRLLEINRIGVVVELTNDDLSMLSRFISGVFNGTILPEEYEHVGLMGFTFGLLTGLGRLPSAISPKIVDEVVEFFQQQGIPIDLS